MQVAAHRQPLVTVIIATYNWSAALRLAVRSVLLQDFDDFELLVVGDACTDDSESVIASFCDPRIVWHNLPERCGNQSGPNNYGIARARGQYIAYLGHDDLWWPTHLASLVTRIFETGADVVGALAIMYGPPTSGVRSLSGLFSGRNAEVPTFFVPSSMLHTRASIHKIRGWRSPAEADGPIDVDMQRRMGHAGMQFAATESLTVFKFNAAWRRNAYKIRDVSEQIFTLKKIENRDECFRDEQVLSIVQAAVDGLFNPIDRRVLNSGSTIQSHIINEQFKGAVSTEQLPLASETEMPLRFHIEGAYAAHEWHVIETDSASRWRWSGPSSRSSFALPVRPNIPLVLQVHVLGWMKESLRETARLTLDGRDLAARWEDAGDGTWLWSALLTPAESTLTDLGVVTIVLSRTYRVLDVYESDDGRWAGVRVGEIALISIGPTTVE